MASLIVSYYWSVGDPNYDKNSEKKIGHRDNTLTEGLSCALNKKAKNLLRINDKKARKLLVTYYDGTSEIRTYDDSTGYNEEPRIYLFEKACNEKFNIFNIQ